MENTFAKRWSPIVLLVFFTVVIFLFFHLYLRKPQVETQEIQTSTEITEPTISIINPIRGKSDAPITIVEFSDYKCEHCRDMSVSIDTLRREFPETIRQVWKDFPNEELHAEATSAAIAARCADQQGAFWTYHDLLYSQMNLLDSTTYQAIAEAIELDMDIFSRCLSSQEPLPRIQRDFEEGLDLKITATPTIFVNGERFVGSISTERLREIISDQLQ